MSERCIYCGMGIEGEGVTREIEGEKIKFCSLHCSIMFGGLEKKGRMKAAIMIERAEILSKLEEERGTKVITLIHRREPWEEKDENYINIEDTEHVLMNIRQTPEDKDVDLILHTPGGLVLAADEIIMEKDSVLGPVDPQIKDIPAGSLISLLNKKPIGTISDENIMLSDIARKSLVRVIKLVEWLLEDRMEREKAQDVADFLTGGYITHGTPITFEVVKEFGLEVKKGVPDHVYDLFRTFEFGACPRPQYAKY